VHGVWEGTEFPRWGANPFLHSHSRTGAYQIVYEWSVKTFWWRCHTAFLILDVFVVFIKVEVVSVKDMANIIGCSTLTWTALLRNPAGSSWKPTSLMTPLVLQSGNVTSHRRGQMWIHQHVRVRTGSLWHSLVLTLALVQNTDATAIKDDYACSTKIQLSPIVSKIFEYCLLQVWWFILSLLESKNWVNPMRCLYQHRQLIIVSIYLSHL